MISYYEQFGFDSMRFSKPQKLFFGTIDTSDVEGFNFVTEKY